MATLRFTRDELIQALEARRGWAEKFDAKKLAEHQKAEAKALKDFHAKCEQALKCDYKAAKSKWRRGHSIYFDPPTCPTSTLENLKKYLRYVKTSGAKTYVVTDRGEWSSMFFILTHDENAKSEMC